MGISFQFHSFLLCLLALPACVPGLALGDPLGSNNWHLNSALQVSVNAALVCKVRVISVRDAGLAPSNMFWSETNVRREIATAEVISVVQGRCGREIEIEYYFPRGGKWVSGSLIGEQFTELLPGETCLVFLQEAGAIWRLNGVRGKARVAASPVAYTLGDEPLLRVLAEFIAGADSEDEMVRLQAAEELGYIGDELVEQLRPFRSQEERGWRLARAIEEARRAVRKARSSQDLVIRSTAVMSSFKLVDPPSLEDALRILQADPNAFGPAASGAKHGVRDFSVSSLQKRLLETMDSTTRRFIRSLDSGEIIRAPRRHADVYRGVPGFPYARFYRFALGTNVVARDAEMRRSIANVLWIRYETASVPEMVRLLDDSEAHIRQTAVSALNECVNRNFSNAWDRDTFYRHNVPATAPGPTYEKPLEERLRDYELNEREYIQYWKDWWRENRSKYEGAAEDYEAVSCRIGRTEARWN